MLDLLALQRTLDAFLNYSDHSRETVLRPRINLFGRLPEADLSLVGALLDRKTSQTEVAIRENTLLAKAIYDHALSSIKSAGNCTLHEELLAEKGAHKATPDDQAIARSSIRQLWRDWSIDGSSERNACHLPVVEDVSAEFGGRGSKADIRILIPGAGLCRLAFTLAALGYNVEANELSYHQILTTNFVLNQSKKQTKRYVYPWAYQFSNHLRQNDQFRSYEIPDIFPVNELDQGAILHTAGVHGLSLETKCLKLNSKDFQRDYLAPCSADSFDAVATVFFLDCAPNVLAYIRTIHHVLKPGGIWMFCGPLLWNCFENGPPGRREGDPDDDEATKVRQLNGKAVTSVTEVKAWDEKLELAFDEILEILPAMGFTVELVDENCGSAGYALNRESMLQNVYRLGHWVARKSV